MEGCSSIGSIDGFYKRVIDLDENYWTTKEVKNKLVSPVIAPQFKLSNMLLPVHYDIPKYFFCTKVSMRGPFACYLSSTYRQFDSSFAHCTAWELVDPVSETGSNSEGYAKGPTM